MALEYKDYYKILGVPPTAGEDQIRKAFRKLAREFHPDVARDKRVAEGKFKEINEAYEVLSDPAKRSKYDQLGADWQAANHSRSAPHAGYQGPPGSGFGQGQDFEFQFGGTGFSDFFEQIFGARAGSPHHVWNDSEDFTAFSERGQDVEADILVSLEEALRGSVRTISLQIRGPCDRCHGSGRLARSPCPSCHGVGQTLRTDQIQVRIPPGVRHGQRLRLAGRGQAGAGKGTSGDLFLRVRLARHPDFVVDGDHLVYTLELAPWEAVLGVQVTVPTLAGPVSIKVPPGSQNGQRLRIRTQGLPLKGGERGDLHVQLRIEVPERISESERFLWQELAGKSPFNPRQSGSETSETKRG
jgi:curved DNA-binding protein